MCKKACGIEKEELNTITVEVFFFFFKILLQSEIKEIIVSQFKSCWGVPKAFLNFNAIPIVVCIINHCTIYAFNQAMVYD